MVKIFVRGLDYIILAYDFININRKALITTSIGLILALAIITGTDLVISSQSSSLKNLLHEI